MFLEEGEGFRGQILLLYYSEWIIIFHVPSLQENAESVTALRRYSCLGWCAVVGTYMYHIWYTIEYVGYVSQRKSPDNIH